MKKEKEENIWRRKILVCGGEGKWENIRRRKIFVCGGEEKRGEILEDVGARAGEGFNIFRILRN